MLAWTGIGTGAPGKARQGRRLTTDRPEVVEGGMSCLTFWLTGTGLGMGESVGCLICGKEGGREGGREGRKGRAGKINIMLVPRLRRAFSSYSASFFEILFL